MTGFVQRLAAGATRARPRLHPLVGSIFGPVAPEAAALPEIDRLVEIERGSISPALPVRARARAPADRSSPEAVRAKPPAESQGQSPVTEAFQPLVVPPPEGNLSALSEIIGRLAPTAAATLPDEPAVAAEPKPLAVAAPRPVGSRRSETVLPARNEPIPVPRQLGASPRRERGAEDIQIHIGRIEVIAVPPPVAAPKTAPAPKAMSLDDYLSRRNRGAR
jgi:hypothetical protein